MEENNLTKVLADFSTLADMLKIQSRRQGDSVALVFYPEGIGEYIEITYKELDERASKVASGLVRLGATGRNALLLHPSGIEFVVAFFGCIYAGVTAVPVNPPRNNRNLARFKSIILNCDPAVVLSTQQGINAARPLFEQFDELKGLLWQATDDKEFANESIKDGAIEIDSERLAFMQYTSGSTGDPKGVMVTHSNLLHNLQMMADRYEIDQRSVMGGWLPLFHDMGLIMMILEGIYSGIKIAFMPPAAFLRQPFAWLKMMSDQRVTHTAAPNFAYELCVLETTEEDREELDLSCLRIALNGAEPVRKNTQELFKKTFISSGFNPSAFLPAYGLAEATLFVSCIAIDQMPHYENVLARPFERFEFVPAPADTNEAKLSVVGLGLTSHGQKVKIVDPYKLEALPDGRVGEIWLSGPSMAVGYWNRPEATKETFQAYTSDTGEGPFLRTGDLGCVFEGHIYITGRFKDLIIIRGDNYYPQDIESAVENVGDGLDGVSPKLKSGDCIAFAKKIEGEERVVIVAELDRHYLRDWRRQSKKPETSSNLVSLDQFAKQIKKAIAEGFELDVYDIVFLKTTTIPKTSSGKVQRRRCSELYDKNELETVWSFQNQSKEEISQETPENNVVDLCKVGTLDYQRRKIEILEWLHERLCFHLRKLPHQLSLTEQFTEMGVDSVRIMRLTGELDRYLNARMPINLLWDYPSPDELAGYLASVFPKSEILDSEGIAVSSLLSRYEPFPLSDIQQAFWLGQEAFFNNGKSDAKFYAEFKVKDLDVDRLNAAWNMVVQRHDALRSEIHSDGQQAILADVPHYSFNIIDVQDHENPQERLLEQRQRYLNGEISFTGKWPLFDISLLKLPNDELRLHFAISFLIIDIESCQFLMNEWRDYYHKPSTQKQELNVTFQDYIRYEMAQENKPFFRQSLAYWEHRQPTFPDAPRLPVVSDSGNIVSRRVLRKSVTIPADRWQSIKQRLQKTSITPSMFLCTAFSEILALYSQNQHFGLGVLLVNRHEIHPDIGSVIGNFSSFNLLEVNFSRVDSFEARAESLQRQLWRDLEHRDVSGLRVLRELRQYRKNQSISYPVIFSSNLGVESLQDYNQPWWLGRHVFSVTDLPQTWLCHQAIEVGDSLIFSWDYVDGLFSGQTIEDMLAAYEKLLLRLSDDLQGWRWPLLELIPSESISPKSEESSSGNKKSFIKTIYENALNLADKIAIDCEDKKFTYADIWCIATQFSRLIGEDLDKGVSGNPLIAVLVDSGCQQVLAALGIRCAGMTVLPLNVEWPKSRINKVLKHSKAGQIIISNKLREKVSTKYSGRKIIFEEMLDKAFDSSFIQSGSKFSDQDIAIDVDADDSVFVLYSSGIHGYPSGVVLTNKGVNSSVNELVNKFSITSDDRIYSMLSLSTDIGVMDMLSTLVAGATLVFPKIETISNVLKWSEDLCNLQITIWHLPADMIELMLEEQAWNPHPKDLRLVLLSGVKIPLEIVEQVERIWQVGVVCLYGFAETSFLAAYSKASSIISSSSDELNLVGKSLVSKSYVSSNCEQELPFVVFDEAASEHTLHVFNERLDECPKYVVGEIYIGGDCLAAGYWNDSQLTNECFVVNAFNQQRYYKTGHFGRKTGDGRVEFIGRKIKRVKLKGHRVSLKEIEYVLNRHPSVLESYVKSSIGENGRKTLSAYIRPLIEPGRVEVNLPCEFILADGSSQILQTEEISTSGLSVKNEIDGLIVGNNISAFLVLPGLSRRLKVDLKVISISDKRIGFEIIDAEDSKVYQTLKKYLNYLVCTCPDTVDDISINSVISKSGVAPARVLCNEHCVIRNSVNKETSIADVLNISSGCGLSLRHHFDKTVPTSQVQLFIQLPGDSSLRWITCNVVWHNERELGVEICDETVDKSVLIQHLDHGELDSPLNLVSIDIYQLRKYLLDNIPQYMIPGDFRIVEKLPVDIDEAKIISYDSLSSEQVSEYELPSNDIQLTLAELFESLLDLEQASIHDNFFEWGGHSFSAISLVERIRQIYGIELPIALLYQAPTIAQLESIVQDAIDQKRDGCKYIPLSEPQKRLWFLNQLDEDIGQHNIYIAYRIRGKLDTTALDKAFSRIIQRHEILRTVITNHEGNAVQIVDVPVPWRVRHHSLEDGAKISDWLTDRVCIPFDIESGPLLRTELLNIGQYDNVLLVCLHHIIADGWSEEIINKELSALYGAAIKRQPDPIKPLNSQYSDYIEAMSAKLSGDNFERDWIFWKRHLEGVKPLNLPLDFTRPQKQSYRGDRLFFNVSKKVTDRLGDLAEENKSTLYMVLLTVFNILLSKYSRQEDIAVGTPVANRNSPDEHALIGFFVNTVVLRTHVDPYRTFAEQLGAVRELVLSSIRHHELPFERLVQDLGIERDLSMPPLFQVMFVLQNARTGNLQLPGVLLERLNVNTKTTQFDLTFEVIESDSGLECMLEYSTDLFLKSTIERMVKHILRLMEQAVDNKSKIIDWLLIDGSEHRELQKLAKGPELDCDSGLVHEVISQIAKDSPDSVALISNSEQLTYGQMVQKVDCLAQELKSKGVATETIVSICLPRSIDWVISMLAVLKLGAAYLPVDANYPSARKTYLVEDSKSSVLITRTEVEQIAIASEIGVVYLDQVDFNQYVTISPVEIDQDNLAYIIYTSGSTGKPKGVAVPHKGIRNLAQATINKLGLNHETRTLQFASPSFDAAASEIYSTMVAGGAMVFADVQVLSDPTQLSQFLKYHGVSWVTLPPTMLALLPNEELPDLKVIISAGEACNLELAKAWSRKCKFINGYGPTEATVCASWKVVDSKDEKITIGTAVDNCNLYVLDEQGKTLPIGVPGELCVGGIGVVRGYLGKADLTAEKFIPDPFSKVPGERLYRTGDLVRWLDNGELEFIERVDNQVKIRGFRIELGEIEQQILSHTEVKTAAVIVREDTPGEKRIVAYIVEAGESLSSSELRTYLLEKIPDYMVPAAWVFMGDLPLTPNGKVDHKSLPKPDISAQKNREIIPPLNPTEEVLISIWSELLKLGGDEISVEDNFFEIGGHSLLVTQLMYKIQEKFSLSLAVEQAFEAKSLRALALRIMAMQSIAKRDIDLDKCFESSSEDKLIDGDEDRDEGFI